MNNATQSPWSDALQRCWNHVTLATEMVELLNTLEGIDVESVVLVLAELQPCLFVVPKKIDDENHIRALVRLITGRLPASSITQKNVNNEWQVDINAGKFHIIISTRLPAVEEKPINL